MPSQPAPQIPRRVYQEGVTLSIVGCGGVTLVGLPQEQVDALVARSIARGVNYFDVSPNYGNGEAEQKLGMALRPYREQVFLACKTIRRDAQGARQELEASLARLHTERLDLYQAHAVSDMQDVERFVAPGGALEVFRAARDQGRVRFLGFSAHSEQAALALLRHFAFDSVTFPINFVCYAHGNYGAQLLQFAQERGAARVAIKALAATRLPKDTKLPYRNCWYAPVADPAQAELAFRFTLSEPVTATLPPGDPGLYEQCLDFAARFQPLTPEERQELLAKGAVLKPIFSAQHC